MRAACFVKTYSERKTINPHHDWTTVLFCGPETLNDRALRIFTALSHTAKRR